MLFLISLTAATAAQEPPVGEGWPTYGGDTGGSRYSSSTQINVTNIWQLHPVWEFHTHALDTKLPGTQYASFEATPVLSHDTLYFTSPFDVVFALDARTGQQRWSFDPHISGYAHDGIITSRGVALWHTSRTTDTCNRRVFFGTLDGRLLALDADTGLPCTDFGHAGTIDLRQGIAWQGDGYYGITSPPTVIGNAVIIGSSIGDNQQVDAESGLVRAFDTTTGEQLWSWEPLPWAQSQHPRTGAGNTWSTISADPALNMVYLPTGSPSPDYFGGLRSGDNRDADSIVALDARTGRKIWAFQVVHHDLWDYDIASQPLLFTFKDGTPAIAVTTKMGMVFVFDRRTGKPLYPITEKPVPQTTTPGEQTSRTQPFSSLPPLAPLTLTLNNSNDYHRSLWNRLVCRFTLATNRYDGIYTPPSLGGSILYPGNLGGVNWGSAAFDPSTGILYANNNRVPFTGRLIPRNGFYMKYKNDYEPDVRDWRLWIYAAMGVLALNILYHYEQRRLRHLNVPAQPWIPSKAALLTAMIIAAIAAPACFIPPPFYLSHFGHELSPQRGTPYLILRDPINDANRLPCGTAPFGAMTALNLNTGKISWQSSLGTMVPGEHTGSVSFGGPIVTASGLVFTASTRDLWLRALDASTGDELWHGKLPSPAQSTPMTYTLDGRQYIVIAAGGHASNVEATGDSLVAFAVSKP
jgi:quinoprotein glucose dehydrogenase